MDFIKNLITRNGNFLSQAKYFLFLKICEIKYARIQGKIELEKHFKDTIVF